MTIDPISLATPGSTGGPAPSSVDPTAGPGLSPPSNPFAILLAAANTDDEPGNYGSSSLDTNLSTSSSPTSELASLINLPGANSGLATSGLGNNASSGSAVVTEAAQYLGVPYVWGGAAPNGFDCSGLVQYVFGQLGVALPRTAAEQEQVGTAVPSLSAAQPGDLLFFEPGQNGAPPGEAGHVGIYVGNGEMIDAPQTGENVQIQPVTETPIAIRRVGVTDGDANASNGTVQVGSVAVPTAYAGTVAQASSQTGTPAPLLAALLEHESGFSPDAVSSAGAEGIAQIMPGTATSNGINPFDPTSAIKGAANLLTQYHAAFGSWSDALAAYAAGPNAVETAGGVPNDGTTPSYVAQTLSLAGMDQGS